MEGCRESDEDDERVMCQVRGGVISQSNRDREVEKENVKRSSSYMTMYDSESWSESCWSDDL